MNEITIRNAQNGYIAYPALDNNMMAYRASPPYVFTDFKSLAAWLEKNLDDPLEVQRRDEKQ